MTQILCEYVRFVHDALLKTTDILSKLRSMIHDHDTRVSNIEVRMKFLKNTVIKQGERINDLERKLELKLRETSEC